tara:strand:- start:170 stop:463 length:294 start_codon:yes stop_codon:yes gene_type:complete
MVTIYVYELHENHTQMTPVKPPKRQQLTEEEKKANHKIAAAKWYAKNRERQLEKQRLWSKKNAEHKRDYQQKYYCEHLEEIKEKKRQKRLELKLNKI